MAAAPKDKKMATGRNDMTTEQKKSCADRIFTGFLNVMLGVLVVPVLAVVTIASPVLGISIPIGGLALAFRRRIGQLTAGVILLALGIALLIAALASSEPWEDAGEYEYGAWVADRRRNPCGPREALLLVSFAFLAAGTGLGVRQIRRQRSRKPVC